MHKISGIVRSGIAILLLMGLSACVTQFRNHGYVPTEEDLANVIVGKDTKDTVATTIGRPTAAGILDDSGWYYIESRFSHYAYQAPKEIDRQVLAISFDSRGRVSNIERFGLEKGRVIVLSRRVTETSASKSPFLRQLLGNIGRIPTEGLLN